MGFERAEDQGSALDIAEDETYEIAHRLPTLHHLFESAELEAQPDA